MTEPIFRGFNRAEEVRLEAQRCGGCNKECMSCPISIDIPKIMELLKDGYFDEAGKLLVEQNAFAVSTGRLCDAPCQKSCPHDINIKAIERFLGDNYSSKLRPAKKNKKRVAVVGAGTAGLTSAHLLLEKGYDIHMFDANACPGGFVKHYVSDNRFPSKLKDRLIDDIMSHVTFYPLTIVGAAPKVEELNEEFEAVIIATGANSPTPLAIPGEHLQNAITSSDFLRGSNVKGHTVVIGGNQVALDVARLAARKADTVTLLDRRNMSALNVDPVALSSAQEEGIRFMLLTQPVAFHGEKKVESVECVQMMVTQSDFDDSWISSPMEDSNFIIPCDRVIVSIGFDPNPSMRTYCPDLRCVGKGRLWTDENTMTTIQGVFAAGEIVLGSSSPAKTIAHARKVVNKVDAYLSGGIKNE